MNRLYSILACTALIAISSCTVKEEMAVQATRLPSFYGTVENLEGDFGTKAFIDSDDNLSYWNDGDLVSIFYANTRNKKYTYIGFDGTVSGRFDPVAEDDFGAGEEITSGLNYAIYPYDDYNACQRNGTLIIPFPKEQTYKHPDGIGVYPILIAKSETKNLPFKHAAGYLGFQLYGTDVNVASITLQSKGGEPLSGAPDVTYDDSGNPVVTFMGRKNDDPSCTVIYNPAIPLDASEDGAKTFWITLPPTILSQGITLIVKDTNGGVYTRESTLGEIKRNQTQRTNPIEVIPVIQTIPVESITVEPTNLTLIMTETESATLTATVLPEDATDPTVTWSSDNEEVATVDANGVVTAHKAGSAIITATAGEKTATCPVTVHNSISFRFYLTPVDAEINYGETVTYVAHLITTTNGEAVETDVTSEATWDSSDKNVATIAAGTATAVGGGETTISATFDPGGGALTTEVVLTVKDIVTYALKISPTTDDQPVVIIGKTQPFTLTLVTTTNDKAAESDITTSADWSISGDAAILTNNTATGVKEGKVTITGSFKPEGATEPLTASAELTVNKDPNHAGDQTPVEEEEEL